MGRSVVSDAGKRGRPDQAPTAAASHGAWWAHQVQVLTPALTLDPGDALGDQLFVPTQPTDSQQMLLEAVPQQCVFGPETSVRRKRRCLLWLPGCKVQIWRRLHTQKKTTILLDWQFQSNSGLDDWQNQDYTKSWPVKLRNWAFVRVTKVPVVCCGGLLSYARLMIIYLELRGRKPERISPN